MAGADISHKRDWGAKKIDAPIFVEGLAAKKAM
jgi:hypothetical protein